jgi:hypothetical protein
MRSYGHERYTVLLHEALIIVLRVAHQGYECPSFYEGHIIVPRVTVMIMINAFRPDPCLQASGPCSSRLIAQEVQSCQSCPWQLDPG